MTNRVTRRDALAAMAVTSPLLVGGSVPADQVRPRNLDLSTTDADAFGNGDGKFHARGEGARSRTLADKLAEGAISIADYGAIGDGDPANSAINTAAIQAAMVHAGTLLPRVGGFARLPEIFVPPGVFVVDPQALNPPSPTFGLGLRGTGWFSSVLRLAPGGGERWMFNNADGHELLAFPMFTDLCFEGHLSRGDARQVPAGVGFMRVNANNTAQGFRFERCLIQGFDTCLRFEGSNLASENKLFGCKIFGCNTVAVFANPQSFKTDFIGTEIEEIYRSVFHFLPSNVGPGGGAVRVSHASLLPAGDCAIVRMESSMLSQGVVIRDTRVEMRGSSRFFQGHADLAYGELTLVDCGILNTERSGVRQMAEVGPAQTLRFVRCLFNTLGQDERYAFIAQRNRYMSGPQLIWNDCQLPHDLAAKIDNRGDYNHGGQASARGWRTNEGQGNDPGEIHAADFDLFGQGDGALISPMAPDQGGNPHLRRKSVALKLQTSSWPRLDGHGGVVAETRLILPPHAQIVRIVLMKQAGGASTASVAFRVRTAAGAVLLDTPAIAQNGQHVARYDPESDNRVPHQCGVALPRRTVVLTCGPGTASTATEFLQAGYAYLEYF